MPQVKHFISDTEAAELDEACLQSFDVFAMRAFRIVNPGTAYEWNWHINCIAEHLEACYRGEIKSLIINIPPRHLKSFLVSVAFPAWVLGLEPWEKFIMTSYKFDLAKDMSQNCRSIMEDAWYQHLFPDTRLSATQAEKHNFETTKHGQFFASATTSVTGKGAGYVISDDPIKPDEALSEQVRNTTNGAMRNTIFSRFNDARTGRFIMVMQRLHEDDPTGNLAKDLIGAAKKGVLLKLPAEAHERISISLPVHRPGHKPELLTWPTMEKGDVLFEQRMDKKILTELRERLTEYNYAGQYLQEPMPLGGGEFKDQWIQYYPGGSIRPRTMNVCILVDPSAGEELNKKKGKTSDWTAMMVVGLAPDNNYYLLDMIRDRLNPTDRVNTLFMLHRKWNALIGKPPKVGYEKYGMMSDTHYITKKMNDDGYRFQLETLGGSTPKPARIRRLIPDLQQGRWWFPANLMYTDSSPEGRTFDLVRELVYSEMPAFPRAQFDDMLDALSRVYDAELMMTFPALPVTETQRVIDSAYPQNEPQGWEDF